MKRIYQMIILLFACVNLLAQNKMVKYEYWLDNNYSAKVETDISPVQTLNWQTTIPCQNLDAGLHVLNVRFKDSNGQWSPPVSSYFYKLEELPANNKMTVLEYWLDNEFGQKKSEALAGSGTVQWQKNIPVKELSIGLHSFNIRFKDEKGRWSVPVSSYFYKLENEKSDNSIVAYEYWLDNAERKKENTTPSQVFNLSTVVPVKELETGIHCFHIRFKDQYGQWSTVESRYFQKLPDLSQNKLVAYEYWFNGNYEDKQVKTIENQLSFVILNDMDIRKATKATNTIHFRFKDKSGNWSSVMTNEFWRPVEPDFTSIVGLSDVTFTNTSKYADKYEWDFGDGSTGEQVNPEHTYAEPGAYQVKLIAHNKEFTDSVFHYVEVEGIRAISSNKGGNGGYVTVNIYGGGLGEATRVKLQKSSITIIADSIKLIQEGVLWAKFNLIGKECGVYNVIVETTSGIKILENGFTIENYIKEPISADIIGNTSFIIGRPQEITIQITNNSNVDMEDIPIIIETEGSSPSFSDKDGNILIEPQPFIPLLPAGSSLDIKYKITANGSFGMNVIPQNNPINVSSTDCLLTLGKAGFDALENDILDITPPPYACAYLIIKSQIVTVKENVDNMWDPWYSHLWNWATNTLSAGKDCGYAFLDKLTPSKWIKYVKYAQTIESRYNDVVTAYDIYKDCFSSWNLNPTANPFAANLVISYDPNEIIGLSGYGEQNFIQKKSHLNYTLYFENDAEKATAPAQEIFLADTLDLTKFNPEDFSFGTFTFRDITVEAIPGVTEFSKDVDMRERGENIIVRISATFDKAKGIVRWHLIALDPETMDLTESPYLGILYPNTAPPIGDGNVTYRIGVKNDLPDGTVIANQAHITFDLNEPIATNVYKNTFDFSGPNSRMNAAYEIVNDTSIVVSWSGSDTGSGIRSYTVYVSENEGEYSSWLMNTTETAGTFEGKSKSKYKFYVIATDNVGNVESKNETAELTVDLSYTAITSPKQENRILEVTPNPVDNIATITMSVDKASKVKLVLYNLSGQAVLNVYEQYTQPGKKEILLDTSGLASGAYMLEMTVENNRIVRKITVK